MSEAIQPIILVAGLGRCGTTAVMTMLAAGGMPVVGTAPDFEDPDALPALAGRTAPTFAGRAMKALDLHRAPCLAGYPRYRAIWLDRTPKEQARSACRFLAAGAGFQTNRSTMRGMEATLRRDRPRALAYAKAATGGDVLKLQFEEIIGNPLACARRMAVWLGREMDIQAMATAVHRRSPRALNIPIETAALSGRASEFRL